MHITTRTSPYLQEIAFFHSASCSKKAEGPKSLFHFELCWSLLMQAYTTLFKTLHGSYSNLFKQRIHTFFFDAVFFLLGAANKDAIG